MRFIEVGPRPPAPDALCHTACIHRSEDDLLDRMEPLARAALDRGEPVALALRPTTQESLVLRLGEPSKIIRMGHPDDPATASGQTLAARRARELRSLTEAHGRVTVLSEHWDRYDGPDGTFWTELDAALAIALADLPVSLTCFFPDLPLHKAVLDGAMANHPVLLTDGGDRVANPEHLPPREVVAASPAQAPVVLRPPDLRRQFGAWALNEVRIVVERELIGIGFDRERAEDVVLAVNEITTNAVEHGSPEAEVALWTEPDGIVAEVHDRGVLADVLPGMVAPHPSEPRGRGVWIARQICDSLHVWADARGTHVRVRAAP